MLVQPGGHEFQPVRIISEAGLARGAIRVSSRPYIAKVGAGLGYQGFPVPWVRATTDTEQARAQYEHGNGAGRALHIRTAWPVPFGGWPVWFLPPSLSVLWFMTGRPTAQTRSADGRINH